MTQPSNEQLHRQEQAESARTEPPEEALPGPVAKGHAKQPQGHHDDEYALAAERAEVEMGSRDYVPADVPDAEPDAVMDTVSDSADTESDEEV